MNLQMRCDGQKRSEVLVIICKSKRGAQTLWDRNPRLDLICVQAGSPRASCARECVCVCACWCLLGVCLANNVSWPVWELLEGVQKRKWCFKRRFVKSTPRGSLKVHALRLEHSASRNLRRALADTNIYTNIYARIYTASLWPRSHPPAHTNLMPRDTHTHAHTQAHRHTHTQAAWHNCMEAGMCLHGTKVALSCQRLTFALAHTPECTPAFMLRWCHACNIYTQIHLFRRQRNGRCRDCGGTSVQLPCSPALAFIYSCTDPHPSAACSHRRELSNAAKIV